MSKREYVASSMIAVAALTVGFSLGSHPLNHEAAVDQMWHPIENVHEAIDSAPYAARHWKTVLKAGGLLITHTAKEIIN